MTELLLYVSIALSALCLLLVVILLLKSKKSGDGAVMQQLEKLDE